MQIYDITVPSNAKTLAFPGDQRLKIKEIASFSKGDGYELHNIEQSLHFGTHIDFPIHIIKGGQASNDYKLDRFYINAQVVEIIDTDFIEIKHLKHLDLLENSAILFKTRNSRQRLLFKQMSVKATFISDTAAEYILQFNPQIIGIDYLSPEPLDSADLFIHKLFLGNDILILESIDLFSISPGKYLLQCFPLKLDNTEASPVRAILFK
ncbi:MAG: cyclase family protein [Candidatus Zixiibacteriota bacterium]